MDFLKLELPGLCTVHVQSEITRAEYRRILSWIDKVLLPSLDFCVDEPEDKPAFRVTGRLEGEPPEGKAPNPMVIEVNNPPVQKVANRFPMKADKRKRGDAHVLSRSKREPWQAMVVVAAAEGDADTAQLLLWEKRPGMRLSVFMGWHAPLVRQFKSLPLGKPRLEFLKREYGFDRNITELSELARQFAGGS